MIEKAQLISKTAPALAFILCVVSLNPSDLGRLLLYAAAISLLAALVNPPARVFFRSLAAVPFCAVIGISNIVTDRRVFAVIEPFGIHITSGAVSCAAILTRAYICVLCVMLLASVTTAAQLSRLTRANSRIGGFISTAVMTFRFIGVIPAEARSMATAYRLRGGGRGVHIKHAGSFVGLLFIRSYERAGRVHTAMRLRGGDSAALCVRREAVTPPEVIASFSICAALIVIRII